MTPGHRQIDHTADLALELWADDEAALLAEGARAITEVLTEGAAVTESAERRVAVDAVDGEDRLVQWLNEILYVAVTEGFLFGSAEIALSEGRLEATVRGEPGAGHKVKTELKSVTYHDLQLTGDQGSWRARIVIDV